MASDREAVRADTALRSELIAAFTDRIVVLEQDNEGLSRHTAFMERYRMRAARYGAAAQGLLDALDPLIVTDPEGEAGANLARFDAAVSYLRRLLDDPPGRADG